MGLSPLDPQQSNHSPPHQPLLQPPSPSKSLDSPASEPLPMLFPLPACPSLSSTCRTCAGGRPEHPSWGTSLSTPARETISPSDCSRGVWPHPAMTASQESNSPPGWGHIEGKDVPAPPPNPEPLNRQSLREVAGCPGGPGCEVPSSLCLPRIPWS